MGWEHEPETVWRAQELYCVDCLSFERVADITGVAASTLKRWSEKYDWREKREQIARAEAEIRVNKVLSRAKAIEALLARPRADMAFAVQALESLAMKEAEAARKQQEAGQRQETRVSITTRADAIAALKTAIENKLNALLTAPSAVDLKAVREVSACLDLLDELQAALPQADGTETKSGLDDRLAAGLRKALGLE